MFAARRKYLKTGQKPKQGPVEIRQSGGFQPAPARDQNHLAMVLVQS